MNFSVSISNQAEEDLADIYSFILNEYKSQINADAVLGRLYTEINNLSFMADGYHLYPNEPWYSRGLRYFSINDYSIFYIIKDVEDRKEARVTHVTNGKRDLDRFLSDMKID